MNTLRRRWAAVLLVSLFVSGPASADRASFEGWRQAESDHFVFIYEPRDEASVRELVTFADGVYDQVTAYFDFYPERLHVVVNGRTDQANGYFTPFPNHMQLFITSPSTPALGAQTESWLNLLFIHEFTHYVHLTYRRGIFGGLSRVFGELLQTGAMAFMPGWYVEGIATNLETTYTAGGRGRNAFFEMYSKAPIMDGSLFSRRQAAYGSTYPPPGRIYVGGHILVEHLRQTYGDDVFAQIHDAFVRFPFLGPARAIKKVTGRTSSQVYRDMKAELSARFAPYQRFPAGRLVSPEQVGHYHLPVSTERGLYLYRSTMNRPGAVVSLDPATGREAVLFTAGLYDQYSIAADASGSTVVFAATASDRTHPAGRLTVADLYRWERQSGSIRRVTHGEHVWQPALSPDGTTLLAVKRNRSYSDLVEVDVQSGATRVLFHEEQTTVYTPAISPDGLRVAFVVNRRGVQDIVVSDLSALRSKGSAAAEELFPPDIAGDYLPRWRDNETIFFGSDRSGALAVYQAPADGSLPEAPTTPVVQDRVGAFAAVEHEGEIIYGSYITSGYAVKAADPAAAMVTVEGAAGAKDTVVAPQAAALAGVEPTGDGGSQRPAFTWEAAPPSRPYVDLPRLVAWTPFPAFTSYVDPAMDPAIALGPGAFAMGASVLGGAIWQAGVGYYPGLGHPYITGSLNLELGPIGLQYALTHDYVGGYTADGGRGFTQVTQQSLSASLPLISRAHFAGTTFLRGRLGVVHRLHQTAGGPFGFVESFSGGTVSVSQDVLLDTGVSYAEVGRTARADMVAPGFRAGVSAQVPIPQTLSEATGVVGSGAVSYAVRTGVPTLFVRGALNGSFVAPSLTDRWRHGLSPRGAFFGGTIPADPYQVAFLAAVEAFGTLLVADLPLVLQQSLQHVGMGMHLEAEAGVSVSGALGLGRYLYPGVELVAMVGSSAAAVPLTFGVAFRVNVTNPAIFAPQQDISPYVNVGIDSLLGLIGAGG